MNQKNLFKKKNYIFMLIGLFLLLIGFILISGGNSEDLNVFRYDIFSFRRLFIGPIFILAGFTMQIFAIMSCDCKQKEENKVNK